MVMGLVTGSAVELLEVRLTVAPPIGAAALRAMLKFTVLPLVIVEGLIVKLLIVSCDVFCPVPVTAAVAPVPPVKVTFWLYNCVAGGLKRTVTVWLASDARA
jgi:hypothetical protein